MIDGSIYKITKIEEGAFRNMKKLKSVKFGIRVEEIGENAFRNCKKLRLIILPQKLQTIGAGAFRNCKNLKYWIIRSDRIASVGTNAFKDIYTNAVFKTNRKVQKKYRTDFRKYGTLSEKASFISNPAKIRYKGKTY